MDQEAANKKWNRHIIGRPTLSEKRLIKEMAEIGGGGNIFNRAGEDRESIVTVMPVEGVNQGPWRWVQIPFQIGQPLQ